MGDLVIPWLPFLANVWLKNTLCQCLFVRELIISSKACNHFDQLTLHAVFSTWQCIIQWLTPIGVCTFYVSAYLRLRERACKWRTFFFFFRVSRSCWQDDHATSACHQPTSGMFVPCGSRKRWCSSDVTAMGAKTRRCRLLMACFNDCRGDAQWHKHTDRCLHVQYCVKSF